MKVDLFNTFGEWVRWLFARALSRAVPAGTAVDAAAAHYRSGVRAARDDDHRHRGEDRRDLSGGSEQCGGAGRGGRRERDRESSEGDRV